MARSYLGLLITGLTSFLFFYLGQAHLTSEFTPDLARNIEGWSVGCSEAWWWFALDAESLRKYFGIYALITAGLLIVPQTSRKAMRLALGFTSLVTYAAWVNGWELMPEMVVLGTQILALSTK